MHTHPGHTGTSSPRHTACCVRQLDHHCPWTGKCIGRRTITLFYVFTSTLCIHVLLVAFTTVAYFVSD